MRRLIAYIGAAVALVSLTACGNVGGSVNSAATVAATVADAAGAPKPTPCVNTTIDEKALSIVSDALDVIILAAPAMFQPGTPQALNVADKIDRARHAVNAVAAARGSCNAATYTEALAGMNKAIADVQQAIK